METHKVDIFLEQREVAILSPSKIWEILNLKIQISQTLLDDKNATYLYSKIISTLQLYIILNIGY